MKRFALALLVPAFFGLSASVKAADEAVASGKVVLAKPLVSKAKGRRTLFISVYDAASPMPMPFGAVKVPLTKDPTGTVYTFKLTSGSIMQMQPGPVPAHLNLKAKLPQSGMAGPDAPGDLVGSLRNVKKGATNLTLTIDTAK